MTTEKDDHGQPSSRAFGWGRLRESRTDELIGICRGVLADGAIVAAEVAFLTDWLERNEPTRRTPCGQELQAALDAAMIDGRLDPAGETALVEILMKIIGGRPDTKDDASLSTRLPLDDPRPQVEINGRSFCFTGKFSCGSRADCEQAVLKHGGDVHDTVRRDTSFLVIGEIGSRDWLHSSMGTKIEKARRACGNHLRVTLVGLSARTDRGAPEDE
jgi:hypothetical protein